MSNTSTTHDETRRAVAMARALATNDAQAYHALAPDDPKEWKGLAQAAIKVTAILASDRRLQGAETELDLLRTATMQMDSERDS